MSSLNQKKKKSEINKERKEKGVKVAKVLKRCQTGIREKETRMEKKQNQIVENKIRDC